MIRKLFTTLCLSVITVLSAWAQPAGGGSGTSDDPYLIGTAADLKAFAEYVNDNHTSACATLTADIDLSSVCSESVGNWPGIGFYTRAYSGTFDGQGHTISGLYINNSSDDYQGLFPCVYNAHISSLKISGNVTGHMYVGMLTGDINGSSTIIEDVEVVSGTISGGGFLAGFVGCLNNGTLTRCVSRAAVSGTSSNVAGLVGIMYGGTATRCANYGAVTDKDYYCGGLVGQMTSGSLNGCANYGTVKGDGDVGGLVGSMKSYDCTVENCLSAGDVTGWSGAGLTQSATGNLHNCLQTCNVHMGDQRSALLITYKDGDCTNNYYLATAKFYRGDTEYVKDDKVSPYNSSVCLTTPALTAEELSSGKAAYLLQGDQGELWWTQDIGTDAYPTPINAAGSRVYFNGSITCDGIMTGSYSNTLTSGTIRQDHDYDAHEICRNCGEGREPALVDGKYQIATVGNLLWLRDEINIRGTRYITAVQTADLDLSVVCGEDKGNWTPIGDQRLTSGQGAWYLNYDGQNNSVRGLYMHDDVSDDSNYGLFGSLKYGSVSNLRLGNYDIYLPNAGSVGVLAGYISNSPLSNVLVEAGYVVGHQLVGGVVGNVSSSITRCVSYADVTGYYDVGGICGQATGGNYLISECLNCGDIHAKDISTDAYTSSNSNAGGICGKVTNPDVTRCENHGNVTSGVHAGGICAQLNNNSAITDCFSSGTITANEQVGGICSWVYGSINRCLFTGNVVQGNAVSTYEGLILAWANVSDLSHISDCYYSADSQLSEKQPAGSLNVDVPGAQSVSHKAIVSGEVAFKLQGVRSDLVWSQGLNGANLPTVFFDPGAPHRVYLYTGTVDCAGNLKTPATYANSVGPSAVYLDHVYGDDGVCTVCGEYQKPELIYGVYHINNYANLALFRDLVNKGNYTANAVLNADIDLTPFCGKDKGNFEPFKDFRGSFDGKGHKISGFYFDHSDYSPRSTDGVGFFFQAGNNDADTEICNLELEGYVDSNSYSMTALLVGQAKGRLSIHHVTTRGKVLGQGSTAGIVGYMTGSATINDCTNYASVSGGTNSGQGGIVGTLFSGASLTLTNLVNYGTISGNDLAGGVVGYKQDGQRHTLRSVANYGNVSGVRVAGIIGTNSIFVTVEGAYCNGNIEGSGSSGIVLHSTTDSAPITRAVYDSSLTLTSNGSPVDISVSADNGKSIGVSHDDVLAGRAAYLLGEGFGQQIPGGTLPLVGGPRVYYGRYQHAVAEPIFAENRYTNTIVDETYTDHNFIAGVCTICGKHNGEVYKLVENSFDNWVSTNHNHGATDTSDKDAYDLGAVAKNGTLTFDWRVSSEGGYDKFSAAICHYDDDTEVEKLVNAASGEESGKVNYTFTAAGHYYLKLWYYKDGSQSNGADTAWAENIKCTSVLAVPGKVWADVDGDGDFDLDDVNAIREMVLHPTTVHTVADLNEDGEVTIGDVTEAIHQLIMP